MTNGEKLKEIFPDIEMWGESKDTLDYSLGGMIHRVTKSWWNAEYKEPTTKNDLALIHTEGLDEGIRCAMCTNSMKSDRGCDGSCVVDKDMYKKVMDVIENHIIDTDKMIEPTTKENLAIDLIDRAELLKAMDTWDKFGNDPDEGLIPLRTPALQDRYVPYVHYYDMVNCVKGMSSVTLIRPKGHWIIQPSNKEQGERDFIWWKCSECGQVIFSETEHDRLEFHAFCGRCGADMREVEKYDK